MDREKVIKGLHCCAHTDGTNCIYCPYDNMDEDCTALMSMDALELLKEQQSKTGKWIPVTNGRGGHECNQCHDYAPSYQDGDENLSRFCPCCGAKMENGTD